jgi:hypothetical protein
VALPGFANIYPTYSGELRRRIVRGPGGPFSKAESMLSKGWCQVGNDQRCERGLVDTECPSLFEIGINVWRREVIELLKARR